MVVQSRKNVFLFFKMVRRSLGIEKFRMKTQARHVSNKAF